MVYATGNIPVGDYDPMRLANIGLGHGAIDAGGAYTYLNPATGNEFSGVAGFTYNWKNPNTQYRSSIDFHFDWGASHFLTKQLFVGVADVSCDFRNGSKTVLTAPKRHFRSTPNNGHRQTGPAVRVTLAGTVEGWRPSNDVGPPRIGRRVLWGMSPSAGTAGPRPFSVFRISVFRFSFAELSSRDAAQ
jgi:hypothetical protein